MFTPLTTHFPPLPIQKKKKQKTMKMNSFSTIILSLPLLLSSFSASATGPTGSPGTIARILKQQIITAVPPDPPAPSPTPFLTSPSGKYTAFLIRTPTAPNAGGFGTDFCYIQIQETETNQPLWESECAPVSTSNTCTLIFDDAGLEVFDGSNSVYNTQADGNHVNTLELVDEGDMRIVDKDGELAWKATDEPRSGQGCGLPGSVGQAPESPPFADLIGSGSGTGAFGQPIGAVVGPAGQQQPAATGDEQQSVGFEEQPLVDSSPFDSGSFRMKISGLVAGVAFFVSAGFFI